MGRLRVLLLLFENGPGDIADTVNPGPVDLGLHLGLVPCRAARCDAARSENVGAHTLGFIRLD